MLLINSKHLSIHNLTIDEFIRRFPSYERISEYTHNLLSASTSNLNESGITLKRSDTSIEIMFEKFLIENDIKYLKQYYEGVNRNNKWDFYLNEYNYFIELDGVHHFFNNGEMYLKNSVNDFEKNLEAKRIGKKLYRILHSDIKDIKKYEDIEKLAYYIQDEFGTVKKDFLKKETNIDQVIFRQKKLLKLKKNKKESRIIKKIEPLILKYIRTFFPKFPIDQSIIYEVYKNEIIEQLEKIVIEQYINKEEKIIFATNFRFCRKLKRHFNNFYICKRKDSKSIKELYYDNEELSQSIRYRCGINNSKLYEYKLDTEIFLTNETFDISVSEIIAGLEVKQLRTSFYSPALASIVYKLYLQNYTNIIIYDPSAGFGARYLASKVISDSSYIGCDPDTATCKNLRLLMSDKDIIIRGFSEEIILNKDINFSFTCPPYYDTEEYSYNIAQKYVSYENWLEEFVRKTAYNIYQILNLEPRLCVIQVSEKLKDDFIRIYQEVGFKVLEEKSYKVKYNKSHLTKKDRFEHLLCFEK